MTQIILQTSHQQLTKNNECELGNPSPFHSHFLLFIFLLIVSYCMMAVLPKEDLWCGEAIKMFENEQNALSITGCLSFSIKIRGRETYLFLHPLANLPYLFFQPVIVKSQAAGLKKRFWLSAPYYLKQQHLLSSSVLNKESKEENQDLSLPRAQIPSNCKLDVFLRAIFILSFQLYSLDSLQQIIALLKCKRENKL